MHIYTKRDGEQSGPFSVAKIVAKLREGSACLSDLAWHEGAEGWKEISKCDYITREIPPEPSPLPPAAPEKPTIQIKTPDAVHSQSKRAANPSRAIIFGAISILALIVAPVVGILLLCIIVFLWRRSNRMTKALASVIHGPNLYEAEVVGESKYQRALESICGGRKAHSAEHYCFAVLFLEDSNPHDNQAVRIDIDRKTVGYLSRGSAREYRQRLAEAGHPRLHAICKAVIRGGMKSRNGNISYFGVWLDLPVNE